MKSITQEQWNKTSDDYKKIDDNGVRAMMFNDPIDGTCLRPVEIVSEDELYERRANWLKENYCEESDVLVDESGDEFVFQENENGTPPEWGYEISLNRLYLDY